MCDSTETGGSATELSVADAWHGAAVGDEAYVGLGIRATVNAIGMRAVSEGSGQSGSMAVEVAHL
jgi:hypothetical protein